MSVPGRHRGELRGYSAAVGRGGVAGAERVHEGREAPATYRVRLVYEVDGCDDPLAALIETLAAMRPDARIRLVDSGVI